MERLTEKREDKNVIPLRQDGNVKWELCNAGKGDAPTQYLYGEHADKLAAYEGTGLTPEQVVEMEKELGEYKKLEEQGLLLKLPCKVGDTVYIPIDIDHKIHIGVCEGFKKDKHAGRGMLVEVKYENGFKSWEEFSSFGKTTFLTQEEAEAKLKEMEK